MLSRGIVHEDDVLCTAADEKLAVALWYGAPTEFHVGKIHEVVAERVRMYTSAVLLVIVAKPVLPDEASRRGMSKLMGHFQSGILAVDVCIEVDGLFGAALRTMGRAITVASGTRTPTLFSRNVPEAAMQLEDALGMSVIRADTVRRVADGVRTNYSSRRPPAMAPA